MNGDDEAFARKALHSAGIITPHRERLAISQDEDPCPIYVVLSIQALSLHCTRTNLPPQELRAVACDLFWGPDDEERLQSTGKGLVCFSVGLNLALHSAVAGQQPPSLRLHSADPRASVAVEGSALGAWTLDS